MKEDVYNFKFLYLYLIFVCFYIILTSLSYSFIYTDKFYYTMLSDKFNLSRIAEMILLQHKFKIVGYFFIPIILLLKLWIIAGVLFTGLYLFQQEVSYRKCLKIVIVAEIVVLTSMVVTFGWLLIHIPHNANDIQYFRPLSITQLLKIDKIPMYLHYPLQMINVFEFAYWMVLTFGITTFTQQGWRKSLKTVASSYGLALGFWIIFVVFIQLQFT